MMNDKQRKAMYGKNKNFKRIHRISPEEFRKKTLKPVSDEKINEVIKEKKRKEQKFKEERQRRYGTLGELTERFIREGESEDDAYHEAKQQLGIK